MPRIILAYHLCAAAVLGMCLALAPLLDMPVHALTRDPAATTDGSSAVGFLSNMGIVLWAAALGIAVFALTLLRGEGRVNPYVAPLAALASLTALLLADDLFMFHERILPLLADWLQETSPAYGAAIIAIAWRWRHLLRERRTRDLGFYAVFWLGFSAFTDLFGGVPRAVHFLVEDGAKFFGIVAWSVLIAHVAGKAVRYASPLSPPASLDGDVQGAVEMAKA